MIFRKLTIRSFRSFTNEQTLIFPKGSGFFFLTGENKAEPHLTTSAAGKSSILDAITWCLFGKTVRGQGNPDVRNWHHPEVTKVTLDLKLGSNYYRITRTYKPNVLLIRKNDRHHKTKTQPIKQEQLNNLLELDYHTFLVLVMMGQFNRFFFDLSPTEKLNVFTQILNLGYWNKCADNAKQQLKRINHKIRLITNQHTRERASYRKESKYARTLIKLLNKSNNITKDISNAKERQHSFNKRKTKLNKKLSIINQNIEQLENLLIKLDNKLRTNQRNLDQVNYQLNDINNKFQEIINQPKICPTCNQPITKKTDTTNISRKISELNKEKDLLNEETKNLKTRINRLDQRITNENKEHGYYRQRIGTVNSHISRWDIYITKKVAQHEIITKTAKQQIKIHKKQKANHLRNIKSLKQKIHNNNNRAEITSKWINWFKEIRLLIIKEAVTQLEVEIASNLTQLGLSNWKVNCQIEKENKAGRITRGFIINVQPPDGKQIKWETFCGTETQRLRIAGALALTQLITSRRTHKPKQEFWDEPTSHLNEEGVKDLLNLLETRSKLTNKQVWIIDHRSLMAGNFDQTFKVIKTKNGSKLTDQNGVIRGRNKVGRSVTNKT